MNAEFRTMNYELRAPNVELELRISSFSPWEKARMRGFVVFTMGEG